MGKRGVYPLAGVNAEEGLNKILAMGDNSVFSERAQAPKGGHRNLMDGSRLFAS
jgi:hypothetical protein